MRAAQIFSISYLLALAIVLSVGVLNYAFAFHYPFFVADDWDWLYSAQFSSYRDLAVVWPGAVYNDRPVGALVIKLMYQLFGLNSEKFYFFQLGLHTLNCLLLFWIAKRYVGSSGAFLAAVLAGTWVVANDAVIWTAAIFDLFGTTLCLISIYFWQISKHSKQIIWGILGALVYFLAIRTKEFAITVPILILVIGVLLEGQSWKKAFKCLLPYCLVMVVLGLWYLRLLLGSQLMGGNDAYALRADGVLDNLGYYLETLFYENVWDPQRSVWHKVHLALYVLSTGCLVWGLAFSNQFRKVFLVAIAGFLLLLGPTLLLKNHLGELYLYAPHFFIAFGIGGLYFTNHFLRLPVVLLIGLLIAWPFSTQWYRDKANFYVSHIQDTAQQYQNFGVHIEKIKSGTQIFIANIGDWNAFEYQGGKPLKVRVNDSALQLHTRLNEGQLSALFCKATAPKIFIQMEGNLSLDQSQQKLDLCK